MQPYVSCLSGILLAIYLLVNHSFLAQYYVWFVKDLAAIYCISSNHIEAFPLIWCWFNYCSTQVIPIQTYIQWKTFHLDYPIHFLAQCTLNCIIQICCLFQTAGCNLRDWCGYNLWLAQGPCRSLFICLCHWAKGRNLKRR